MPLNNKVLGILDKNKHSKEEDRRIQELFSSKVSGSLSLHTNDQSHWFESTGEYKTQD